MAAYTTGKIKNSKRLIREIFLTFTRAKESNYLGYYRHKLSTPVFRKREVLYRQNVLRPLEQIPTLEDRLKELNVPDPVLDAKVNIGFECPEKSRVPLKERLEWHKIIAKNKSKYLAEGQIYEVDLSEVEDDWIDSDGRHQLYNIADHYGIYKDLYEHGYFIPCVPLKISYDFDEHTANPVCVGNVLQASHATKTPNVSFKSKSDDLWSLVLTNLDGHLLETNSEYLHWFVGNIKGSELKSGEVICDYLQPFPMRGSGYHRLVFVLYKQNEKIDFSSLKRKSPCLSLKERTFKTFNFYKEYQDMITPAGLAFFQCVWDESLTDFFHNVLNMQEPVFEYLEPPVYVKPQVQFPHLQPFNLYLDRYRDPKEINKEVLLKRLNAVEPFKEEKPMPKYPLLHKPEGYRFSWQRQDFKKQRLRLGKYRALRPHSVYPQEDDHFKPYFKT